MKKQLLSALALCLFSQVVNAEAIPKSTPYDKRIKNVIYNADNVTRVNVSPGIATLIQLSASEYITEEEGGLGLGDPLAWNVNVRNSNVWIRPKAEEPDTNLTIVTNKRTYILNLVSVKNKNAASWGIRYTYPEPPKNSPNYWSRPCQGGVQNFRYFGQGDKSIFPSEVWDNGTFTCMRIKSGTDMPVVFKKLPDGKEGLVNSHIENDYIVIHEVNSEYRVRLGDLVAGVKTDRLKPVGNVTGTTNGKTREIIND